MSSSFILNINSLSDVWFASIFSYWVGCLAILLMASFAMSELSSLMCYHFFIFNFVAFPFGVRAKKSSPILMSRGLLPVFSYRNFRVSGLRFKSLIHLEFIFVCFFYMWLSSFSNTIYGRDCPFPVVYSCIYYFNWFWHVNTCLQMSGSSLECKLHKGMSPACSLFKL